MGFIFNEIKPKYSILNTRKMVTMLEERYIGVIIDGDIEGETVKPREESPPDYCLFY